MKYRYLFLIFPIAFFSCGEKSDFEGTYAGILVMEDGTNEIEISLMPGGTASLVGFHETTIEGEWKGEKIGETKREGIWANFVFPNYRLRFELEAETDGLRVERMSIRKTGKTILRTLKLKKERPLLIRKV